MERLLSFRLLSSSISFTPSTLLKNLSNIKSPVNIFYTLDRATSFAQSASTYADYSYTINK